MMKKLLLVFIVGSLSNIKAEIGCMDNSKYMDLSDGYDYKTYHYVYCTCPCNRYAQSFHRGLCEQCLHFRSPKDLIVVD